MACPFGFGKPTSDEDGDVDSSEDEKQHRSRLKAGLAGGTAAGGANRPADDDTAPTGDDRFNFDKDPVSWFFQNQIKSEEELQARKTELRAAARKRLDAIFEAKGKRLLIDSDDEFSVGSSELSAWDSDVASISSLSSCVREWREEAHFAAPAEAVLQVALLAVAGIAAHTCWASFSAMLSVNRYWGIIHNGWVPTASFAVAAALAALAACCWLTLGATGKRTLLVFQVAFQLVYVLTTALALLSYVMPTHIDRQLKSSAACARRAPIGPTAASQLCSYLPAIEGEVKAHVATIFRGCAGEAVTVAVALAVSAWYTWELCYVEKKAIKQKRRRRHRKHGIPWDKIKVEDMKVTTCGGGPAVRQPGAAAAGGATSTAGAGGSGRCPFAGVMGAGGGAGGSEPQAAGGEPKKTV